MDTKILKGKTELQEKIIQVIKNHKAGEVIHALEVIKLMILMSK